MTKLFIYEVNGETIEDTEAFGKAWKKAKEIATREHTCITRQVIKENDIRNEFYSKACCFLPEKFFEKDKVMVF